MYLILAYDISMDENGPKVWRRTFKTCKKYLSHIQNSVFEGELTKPQIQKLRNELSKNIRTDKDSVIIFKTRNERWLEKEFWGKIDTLADNFIE